MDLSNLSKNGFSIVPAFLSSVELTDLRTALAAHLDGIKAAGIRGIARISPEVRLMAASGSLPSLVKSVIGKNAQLVRSILFNKNAKANWFVAWHQDLTITVAAKAELSGFTGWSEKGGICHVQPPIAVLQQMVTVRIHLDNSDADNGALVVAPGMHKLGRVPTSEVRGALAKTGVGKSRIWLGIGMRVPQESSSYGAMYRGFA